MLTTDELEAVTGAMVWPTRAILGTKSQVTLEDAKAAYKEEQSLLEKQWAKWLAAEYASELPETMKDELFKKAWSKGHSDGYFSVQFAYEELVDFALNVLEHAKNAGWASP